MTAPPLSEQRMVALINHERQARGIRPLSADEGLMRLARERVEDMAARHYLGHEDPVTGELLARQLVQAAGYQSAWVGENWYAASTPPPDLVDEAMGWFMADPPHAANILESHHTQVGVGIAFNGEWWLLVQIFTGP